MSAGDSFLVMITVLGGTLALVAVLRMIGVYGAATHDWTLSQAPPPPTGKPSRSGGLEPGLLVAILTAAAAAELGLDDVRVTEIHEINAQQNSLQWPAQGRQMIMQSHRLRS